METLDFVIDAELFSLFSPINSNYDCIKRSFCGDKLDEDDEKNVMEALYFHEFLKKMKDYKYKMIRNESIRKDYERIAIACDQRVKKKFGRMIATKSYWIDKDEIFTDFDKEKFTGTALEEKAHYVDAATQCEDYRVIVSTKERTDQYFEHVEKLWDYNVNCEEICEFTERVP